MSAHPSVVFLPLFLGGMLVLSGLMKARDAVNTRAVFAQLPMPAVFRTSLFARVFPMIEMIIGGALIVTGGGWFLMAAVVVTVLLIGSLIVVIIAARSEQPVQCNCFGALSTALVTGRTIVRNVLFLALGIAVMILGLLGFAGVPATFGGMSGSDVGWCATTAVATAAGIAVLLYHVRQQAVGQHASGMPRANASNIGDDLSMHAGSDEETFDQIRQRIEGTSLPPIEITDRRGDIILLHELCERRDMLVFFIRTDCHVCSRVVTGIPAWAEALAGVIDVMAISASPREDIARTYPGICGRTFYGGLSAAEKLSIRVTPTLVFLGRSGQVIAGPIAGPEQISGFVTTLLRSLAEKRILHSSIRPSSGDADAIAAPS